MTPAARADRRSPDGWLAAARVALLALAAVTLALYVASVPLRLAELRQVCAAPAACDGSQLSPTQASKLLAAGLSPDFYAGYFVGRNMVAALVFWGVALLILWRQPREPMALLTALLLLTFGANGSGIQALPPAFPALWFPVQLVQYIAWQAFPVFFLLFPNGRWVPRLRYVGWFLAIWIVAFIPGYFFPDSPIAKLPDSLGFIFFPAMFGLCLLGQVYRYRRASTAIERQQTKWVVYGAGLLLGTGLIGGLALPLLAPAISLSPPLAPADFATDAILNGLLFLLLPVTLAVSILRFRLFEIDVIIRRTLIYAVLTALLALAYFGSVLGLQRLFGALTGQQQSTLATVLSTLVIAALFVPLRRRVQATIDRRFFRRRYDAVRTLAVFGAQLRDSVDLEALTEQLLATVDETMQPESITLWFSPADPGRRPL